MLPQSKSINGIPWKKLQGKRLKLSAIRKSVSRPLNKPLCSSVLLEKQPTWYKKKCTPLSQEKQNLPCDQRELLAPFVPCCKTVCSMMLCRKKHSMSCFRHERPQAGRLREFHQFGLEMAGSASPAADAEIISLAKQVMDRVGLKGIALNINSIGCPTCRAGYHQALRAYFADREAELCDTCRTRLEKNPMRILDCKSPICSEIAKGAPVILDYLCQECSDHFTLLQSYLKNLNIDFTINPKIVRGLDYYTKTVFEFVTTEIGAQGTVCGGGRYDGLIEQLGGAPTPAMGFAMGLERLILTMEKQGCAFQEPTSCDLYLAPMDPESVAPAMQLAQSLREMGYRAEYDLMNRGLKAQMKFANKIGAKFVIVLGENERTTKEAKIKWMETGEQFSIHLDDRFPQEFENLAIQFLYQDVLAEFEEEQA